MTESNPPSDPNFSDADARSILRRATEIEKEGTISASRLREVAAEAQISPDALNRALSEIQAEKLAQQNPPAPVAQTPRSSLSWQAWTLVFIIIAIPIILAILD